MKWLNEEDIQHIATGAAVLGTGGGEILISEKCWLYLP